MSRYNKCIRTSHGQLLELGKILGRGGEGSIFELKQNVSLCVKIYNPGIRAKKEGKVRDLINLYKKIKLNGDSKIISIFDNYLAMPREMVYSIDSSKFLGFIMNRFNINKLKSISFFYDSEFRHSAKWNKDLNGRRTLALNLLKIIKILHRYGIIVGDLNEKNVFVTESNNVVLIDCDSFGIVGKHNVDAIMPDIAPPEKNLTQKSDIFVLAIIIYKLFMDGFSPFQFVRPPNCSLEGREIIRMGLSPLRDDMLKTPPKAPKLKDRIPPEARSILGKAIDPDPDNRPSIDELMDAVDKIFNYCQSYMKHTHTTSTQSAQVNVKQQPTFYKVQSYMEHYIKRINRKNIFPVLLSLLIPGLGQIYKRKYFTGIMILFLVLVFNMCDLVPLGFLLWLYSVYDAGK